MTAKLRCIYCGWETEPYDMHVGGGYLEAFDSAKAHIKKKHKQFWNLWGLQGKVIHECFKVVTVGAER